MDISELLSDAFRKRASLFSDPDNTAYRLFNGFCEGYPDITVDRYGTSAVILWNGKRTQPDETLRKQLRDLCLAQIPSIDSVIFKNRWSGDPEEKKGVFLSGNSPAKSIREWGIDYEVDLLVNKDCGFYLDSALLRRWLLTNCGGQRVLNTFAYTGSLGDAAAAGAALSVTQTDLNRNYLSVRKAAQEYLFGDFFHVTAGLRRSGRLFDRIILDPPFYANAGRNAKVDQARNAAALINKIRPLAAHEGKIIILNNALFLSGRDFLAQIEPLCGEWLSLSEFIPVPDSFFGFVSPASARYPADPAPFNHPTKIVILDVRRKDGRA